MLSSSLTQTSFIGPCPTPQCLAHLGRKRDKSTHSSCRRITTQGSWKSKKRTAIFPSCLGRGKRYFTHFGLILLQQVTIKTLRTLLGLGRALAATVESRQKFPKEITKGVTKPKKKMGVMMGGGGGGGEGSRRKDSPCWHQQTALHSHLILETNINRARNQICQVLNCLTVLFCCCGVWVTKKAHFHFMYSLWIIQFSCICILWIQSPSLDLWISLPPPPPAPPPPYYITFTHCSL